MRLAAVDIGTNSVLLLVVEGDRGALTRVEDLATITRLGRGVDATRRLSAEGVARTLECLAHYAERCRALEVERLVVVATSAARDALDGAEFLAGAADRLGARPLVIGGAEEAALTFEGALSGLVLGASSVGVFDVGGGSTEVVVGHRRGGSWTAGPSASVDVGAVRLTERHVRSDPPSPAELEAVRSDARLALEATPAVRGLDLVGVAGTVTTLCAVAHAIEPYDGGRVHGARLQLDALRAVREKLAALPLAERREVRGLSPERADVIVAGAIIVEEVAARAGAHELMVSDRGVRWGLVQRLAHGAAVGPSEAFQRGSSVPGAEDLARARQP